MNRRSAIQLLAGAGAGSFFTRALGDTPPDARAAVNDQDFVLRSDVRLVLLDVSVQDRNGGFVSGLSKENFRVLEDGHSQEITVFDNQDLPVTVGILVDESRSMLPKRKDVIDAATVFIQESNPLDEIFVLNFNDHVMPGLPAGKLFSDDIDELQSALYRGIPQGRTALYDAIMQGLKQLNLGLKSRKALVLVSDGGDNASMYHRHDIVDAVSRNISTFYTIGLFDNDDPDRNPGILRDLARISGGEAFFPGTPPDTAPICRRIAKEIRTRYTIGYRPMVDNSSKDLRHISVQILAPGHDHLTIRTRDTYRYDNGAAKG